MKENVPIASYTELLKRRLNAVRTLERSLRESHNALLSRDAEHTDSFTEQQTELCNEIEFLNRDIRSADEILAWAEALKPDNREIAQLRQHAKSAEAQLAQTCLVHNSLVRRSKRSMAVVMSVQARQKPAYSAPSSYETLRYTEEA